MDDLKPYPAYKDSSVPWLGDVPEHWESRKLRNVLRAVAQRNRPDLPLLSVVREKGVILRDTSNKDENHNYIPDDLTNYKVVRKGQFAMNKMKAWQGSYGVSNYEGIVSPAYFIFDIADVVGGYFHSAIRSIAYIPFFTQASDGVRIGQWDLSQARMREIPFFIPPPEEQTAIVKYLNYVDRRVRRYIRARQKLIKLLEEQKQAIIHQAVTRGLDPHVPLKPSGIDWLGDIPAHWEVRKLKTLAQMKSGESITALSINEAGDFPVFGGNGLRGYTSTYTHEGNYVLIGRQGALCGNIHYARGRFWASEHAVVATLFSGYNLIWYGELLRVMNLNQYSIAAAQPGLSVERVQNLYAPIPSLDEQNNIAQHIESETQGFKAAITHTTKEIALIREYRTRLIADVVTGKLDVRAIAASLPDETDAPDTLDDADTLSDEEELTNEPTPDEDEAI